MELEAVVKYRGAFARYHVSPERGGIYQAYLVHYEGSQDSAPPQQLTLVKSVRHWTGSSDRQELVDEIGYIIEREREGGTSSSGQSAPKEF